MARPEIDFDLAPQPTPEQLERIVTLGMTLAKESGTVRSSRRPNAHVFLPAWVEQPLSDEAYCATVQRVAGRIGKIGYRAYSLWLHESQSFMEGEAVEVIGQQTLRKSETVLSDRESGYVNTYAFKWTHRHVLDATLHHRKFRREGTGVDAITAGLKGTGKTILVPAPMNVIDLSRRREEVSHEGCDVLIDHLRTFGEAAQRAA